MSERGPSDYDPSEKEIEDVAKLLAHSVVRIGSVHNGNGTFQKWWLGVTGAAVLAGALGGVVMYGKMAAVEATVQDLKEEVIDLRDEVKTLLRRRP